jgi:hypothetical protein
MPSSFWFLPGSPLRAVVVLAKALLDGRYAALQVGVLIRLDRRGDVVEVKRSIVSGQWSVVRCQLTVGNVFESAIVSGWLPAVTTRPICGNADRCDIDTMAVDARAISLKNCQQKKIPETSVNLFMLIVYSRIMIGVVPKNSLKKRFLLNSLPRPRR